MSKSEDERRAEKFGDEIPSKTTKNGSGGKVNIDDLPLIDRTEEDKEEQ